MSSTLSDTGPQPAVSSGSGADAKTAPAGAGARRSRPHIIAFDAIRLIIMMFVVTTHTLSFATGSVTMSVGAFIAISHSSRMLFILLTALVLTYNYGHRPLKPWKFWRRRFWLVIPAYVTWSAIYYWANGRSRGAFPSAFLHDLQVAGARYHLYFLLISMQIYLLFPVIRWVLKKTERYHGWLFGLALAYQVWLTIGVHYNIGRHGNGFIAQFLNGAALGYWVTTYVLYVVAGAIAGWNFDALCAFTRRHLGTWPRVAAVASLGVAGGTAMYLIDTEMYGATPDAASAVFRPAGIFQAMALAVALLAAGLQWSDRGAPWRRFAAAGSASSFGIYLAHPLILQGLLRVLGSHHLGADGGLIGALHRLKHSSLEVLVLLLIMVPAIYAITWLVVSLSRRTQFSLLLTGREYKGHFDFVGWPSRAFGRLPQKAQRGLALSLAVVVVLGAGAFTGVRVHTLLHRTSVTRTDTMQVGDLTRSYTTITPASALPASAPIIMVLSGLNAEQPQEINRDMFLPYVKAGQAELVYPLAYRESWNALGCCSWAAQAAVDDLGFIATLVKKVDPDRKRPIYLMGYSNGARLAYRLACTNPLLFDGIAAVKGDPMPGCAVVVPMTILQIASTDDNRVPYKPGQKGTESPPATTQVARLRATDLCSSKSTEASQGNMTYTVWADCIGGTRVGFAVYTAGVHSYPRPPVSFPAASQIVWAFFTDTAIAPLPAAK